MSPDDLDKRVSLLESRLDQVCVFIGSVISSYCMDEVKSLKQKVDQLDSNNKHSIKEIWKKIEDKGIEKIAESGVKNTTDVTFNIKEMKMKEKTARNFFNIKKSRGINIISIRDRNISSREISTDCLDGLSSLMREYKSVTLCECFAYCDQIVNLVFSQSFNTSNVINMKCMFHGCEYLTSLDLSSFDTANVTDMSYMFMNVNVLLLLTYQRLTQVKLQTWDICFMDVLGLFHLTYPHSTQVMLQIWGICLKHVRALLHLTYAHLRQVKLQA